MAPDPGGRKKSGSADLRTKPMTAYLAFLPGPTELWVILLIALLLFGHRIPSMARSLGSGITEFKKGLKGEGDDSGADQPKVGDGSGGAAETKGDG